ncbi:RHS repeat-associated core domain-containing protein [Micromonospora echinospora]|uniref:RHS repeat-associated core domain-containing protein n=1 Tax=Micromonospora echinospora TaxID=1877 RepID=UPI003CF21002
MTFSMVASLLSAVPPQPVTASPAAPAGATAVKPSQRAGVAGLPSHEATTARTSFAGSAGGSAARPPVPGAVGAEQTFPAVKVPGQGEAGQEASSLSEVGGASGGVVAGRSVERSDARTERTTEFVNPDGTKTLRVYDGPAFIRDGAGAWKPIDNRLSRRADGRYAPASAADVSIASRSNDPQVATLSLGEDAAVSFAVDGAAAVSSSVEESTATFVGVRAASDVKLTPMEWGLKEEIVLHSADAPTTWTFPLTVKGVTPALNDATGEVEFTDASGAVRGVIPPGFMVDSNIHPRRGTGERTDNVRYSLQRQASGWLLQVDLDAHWLSDPSRVFPVIVDPSFTDNAETDDTYVSKRDHANRNNSAEGDLLVGTYNGGTERAASYLHFNDLKASRPNKYVLGATLQMWNFWSYSCRARSVNVYAVTKSWSGSTTKTWAGPSYDSANRLATGSFAHGYYDCPSGNWAGFSLPPDRVMKWLHGTEAFYGLTVRASETDSFAWKRFASANFSNSTARPYIDLNYSDQGAKYSLPSPSFSPPVTAASAGRITARVTNWGSTTWTPTNGYRLTYKILSAGGTLLRSGPLYAMPKNVGPHQYADVPIQVESLGLGTYILRLDMVNPSGASFNSTYGIPFGQSTFTVSNGAPTIGDGGVFPPHNGFTDSLTPSLWVDYLDPDNTPAGGRQVKFRICKGTPAAPSGCQSTAWRSSTAWAVPSGLLTWQQPAHWYVTLSDTQASTPELGPYVFTPTVAQPEVSSHLAGAGNDPAVAGLNPYVGNYSTTVTDAAVAVAGPALTMTRTYNSQDLRASGAFGAGWSSPIDQRLTTDSDGSDNVLVTLASGGQLRFGRNPDGTYASPQGSTLTLVAAGSPTVWTLRDSTGTRRIFNADGRLTSVADADGRIQSYTYNSNNELTTITDNGSNRSLHLTWTGGHVTSVATDAPASGETAPRWTYTYTGDTLTQVCTPLSAQSCTTYAYTASSHYRSVVTDDNPAAYWPLGEAADTQDATNVVATKAGDRDGSYQDVTLGVAGALAGSPDTAADFGATSATAVELPKNLTNTSMGVAVELWFKAGTGENGVLFGMQNTDLSHTPSQTLPMLYVDTNGVLRAKIWTTTQSQTQMTSSARVDDGQWHHVVLSGAVDFQQLYLDGVKIGQLTGQLIDYRDMAHASIGNGRGGSGWTGTPTGNFPFTGLIDEAAYYKHPLGANQVSAHWAARTATQRLTTVTDPGGHTALTVAYDGPSGRVTTLTDRNGATWDLGNPTPDNGKRVVVLAPDNAEPITYRHDIDHGGRLVSREDTFGEQKWTYNARGFVSKYTDANNNTITYDTDARGNVLGRTTCRTSTECNTSYAGYYLNATNPLDPRNDVRTWTADARSASATDTTYRITHTLDTIGHITTVSYPAPAGYSTPPTESYTYSTGSEAAEPAGTGTIPAGLQLTATARNGKTTRNYYNSSGDLVRTVDPVGLATTYTRDALGRVTTITIAPADGNAFTTTSYTYNALSQVATTTGPPVTNAVTGATHQAKSTYTYNDLGLRTRQVIDDITGDDPDRTWIWTYDAAGRPDLTTTPDAKTVDQDYDSRGDLTKVTQPSGLIYEYTYDEAHRRTETAAVGAGVDPMNPTATRLVLDSRAYDPAGRLASVVDAMGRETAYTYYGDNLPATSSRVRRNTSGDITSETQLSKSDYNAAGQPNLQIAMGDIRTTTIYDKAGYIKEEHLDPAGLDRAVIYTRNLDGTIATITRTGAASPGRAESTSYTYDDIGRILTETVANTGGTPAALTTAYQRDARGLVTHTTDPAGVTTSATYDPLGNPVTTTGATRTVWNNGASTTAVPVTTIGYNTFGDTTHIRDAHGNTTTASVDPAGRPTSVSLPTYTTPGGVALTGTYHTAYNSQGLVDHTTDPLGRITTHTYDPYGRPLTRTLPDPDDDGPKTTPVWTYTYDRVGDLLSAADPTGGSTSATYNDLGQQITATISDRTTGNTLYLTTNLAYDPAGNLTIVTTPLNHTTTTTYNTAGEPLKVTDPTGRFTQYTYDMAGRPLTSVKGKDTTYVDPVTTQTYDLAGRLTATADCTTTTTGACAATLRTATATYNGASQPLTVTSREGRTSQYGYDNAGQLTAITQRVNPADATTAVTVELGYDLTGQRTRMVDGNANATTYTYTPWGQTASVIEPATTAHPNPSDRTWTTTYDAAGQPVTYRLPGNVSRILTYDKLGNLTQETGTGAEATTATRQLGYDLNGRITSVGGPNGATNYTWNDRDQLTSVTGAAGDATYTYDGEGNLSNRTDAAGTATFTYNTAGALATTADPLTGVTATNVYKNNGQLGQTTYGSGGPTRTYTYDSLGRLATDTYKKPNGTTTASTTYTYDKDDLLLTKTTTGVTGAGTNTYGYDGLARLTTWKSPTNQQTTYGYDNASNRTTVTNPTGTRTTTYDARNRTTTANGADQPAEAWTWTPRGTLSTHTTGTTVDTNTFDAFERLTQATSTGYTINYTYDALDRLAQRNTLPFLYNDLTNQPIRTPDTPTQDTVIFRSPDGQPLSDKAGTAAARNLITDGIHNDLIAASNPSTGDLAASRAYQPYGQPTAATGTLPLGYQGGWTDPDTTQTNAHARWYDSSAGAFTSRDTWTLSPDPVTQTNRYSYANSSPTTVSDPSGHCGVCAISPSAALVVVGIAVLFYVVTKPKNTAVSAPDIQWRWSETKPHPSPSAQAPRGPISRPGPAPSSQPSPTPSHSGSSPGYGSGTPSLPTLHYCERNPHSASCSRVYAPGSPPGTAPNAGSGPGNGAPCTRNCNTPPPIPPCVLKSLAAGLTGDQLCRTPWLLDVDPRPGRTGSTRLQAEQLIAGNGKIGNTSSGGPAPSVRSDDSHESAPTTSGGSGLLPDQAELEDSCFAGGRLRADGTRSARIWLDECADLFEEYGVTAGGGLDLSSPSAENGRSYITYVAMDGDEVRYVGRAQAIGSPQDALTSRLKKGHDVAKANPDWTFKVVDVQKSLEASKGAEEFFLRAYQQRGARLVNSPESPPLGFSRPQRGGKSVRMMDAFFDELLRR